MAKQRPGKDRGSRFRHGRSSWALAALLIPVLALPGCFDPVYPQADRETRIMEALQRHESRAFPLTPLTPGDAVAYALANNLDSRVAELEASYQNESLVASRRRLLPTLTARYSMDHNNHPSARWSESTRSGNQSLESSFSSEPNTRRTEISAMWSLLDFGVGYLRARQQGEKVRYSELQRRRVRQQVVLDVLTAYWRASAAQAIAAQAELLKRELEDQAKAIRDSVDMRILSGAEGARRELVVHNGLADLEQFRRAATQARLELARTMGGGATVDFVLEDFPADLPRLPALIESEPGILQTAALKRRPELYQYDAQERIAVDEARMALLQIAPNVNFSLGLNNDPDKFLEWNNWMTAGARASWNLLNIPARLSERRMAKLQGEIAKQKGLALAMAVMAQVGISYSDWRLSHEYAQSLHTRAAARERLVEALAAGEKDNQTRPGEVLQERVRLLSDKSAAMRAVSESRIAAARLANAVGIDVNGMGEFVWDFKAEREGGSYAHYETSGRGAILQAESDAAKLFPDDMAGLRVVKAEEFLTPDSYFEKARVETTAVAAVQPEHVAEDKVEQTAAAPVRKKKIKPAPAPAVVAPHEIDTVGLDDTPGLVVTPVAVSEPAAPEPEPNTNTEASERTEFVQPTPVREKPLPVKQRRRAGPPNVAESRPEPRPANPFVLPEELQALRPSADAFGGDELPRNDFIDRRAAPAESYRVVLPEEPYPMAVPPGSLRPGSLRPDSATEPETESVQPSFQNESVPPASPVEEIPLWEPRIEETSWEEHRLRALEPLPTLE